MKRTFNKSLLLYALIVLSPVANSQSDPCDNIEGNWIGIWHDVGNALTRDCKWTAHANVTRYEETVFFRVLLSNGNHRRCKKQSVAVSGTCNGARLIVKTGGQNLSGTILGDSIEISNYRINIFLKKS